MVCIPKSWERRDARETAKGPPGTKTSFSYHGLFNLVVNANQASGTTEETWGRGGEYKMRRNPKSALLQSSGHSLL